MLGKLTHRVATMFAASLAVTSVLWVNSAAAQDQGFPFRVQPVGDQVVNGILIQGGTMPVWTDQNGRPGGRSSGMQQLAGAELNSQPELDELARIGRETGGSTTGRRRPAPAPHPMVQAPPLPATPPPATLMKVAKAAPLYDVVDADDLPPPPTKAAVLTKKRTRSDEEEIAALESKMAAIQEEYTRKQREVEARKKDVERRAEEARQAAEREKSRRLLVFEAKEGQLLSEAITIYAGKNGWDNVEWNVGPDFRIKYAYAENPRGTETLKDVLKRVLSPYNLSAELHRPNSVIEIFPAADKINR